jgi:hypothetical protein
MKSLLSTLLIAGMLAAPLYAYAQDSNAPANGTAVNAANSTGAAAPAAGMSSDTGGVMPGAASGMRSMSPKSDTCVGPVSYCTLFFGS